MLNVSIVLYKHRVSDISPLVKILQNSGLVSEIFLIDNSPNENKGFEELNVKYIFNNNNLGYGRAHNIALRKSINTNIPYHLVVNLVYDFLIDQFDNFFLFSYSFFSKVKQINDKT